MDCEKEVVIYPDFGHEGLNDEEDLLFEYFVENL
jgi:hypothetical protein